MPVMLHDIDVPKTNREMGNSPEVHCVKWKMFLLTCLFSWPTSSCSSVSRASSLWPTSSKASVASWPPTSSITSSPPLLQATVSARNTLISCLFVGGLRHPDPRGSESLWKAGEGGGKRAPTTNVGKQRKGLVAPGSKRALGAGAQQWFGGAGSAD